MYIQTIAVPLLEFGTPVAGRNPNKLLVVEAMLAWGSPKVRKTVW